MALQDFCYIFGCASPCSSLSGNFVEWARQVKVDSTIYMIRIDIKHFFMSGTPEHLAEYASRILPQGHRRIYHDAVLWFLHNQYIKSGVIKHSTVFKVVRGAGMGLPASGPIADSVFYTLAEKSWGTNPLVMEAHGIRHYVRFKDDLFVIATNRALTRKWYRGLCRAASTVFDLHVEEVSNIEVCMLSLRVRMEGAHLRVTPNPPPTSSPLSITSAHRPPVHLSWPKACIENNRFLYAHG